MNRKIEKRYDKIRTGDILGVKIKQFYNNEIYYAQLTYDECDFMQDVIYVENMKIVFRNSNKDDNYKEFIENEQIELCEVLRKNKRGGFSLIWKKKKKN